MSETPLCSQESRFAHLEATLDSVSDTLRDVKDLLKSSIQADERIHTLQQEAADMEKRVRVLEMAHAAGRWVERVMWAGATVVVTAVVTRFLKTGG